MNNDQSGLWVRETAPQGPSLLSLEIVRVLDEQTSRSVLADFRFDPGTPMVVSVTFKPAAAAAVTWRIGRELLYRGLFEHSGEWDVRMRPALHEEPSTAWLMLNSVSGSALFSLPVPPLAEWLEATYRIVPAEAEGDALDWDGFLAELLEVPGMPQAE
ncbi:SsgA family sporulation/cell division regulator [Streptomyces sp. WSLK1-5]|uniref:SsgA family sporulation/cell division regulator n=1 Tax=Streptomyces sp. WSLK1-5 TaxID=3375473 RepID=UPI0037AB69BD